MVQLMMQLMMPPTMRLGKLMVQPMIDAADSAADGVCLVIQLIVLTMCWNEAPGGAADDANLLCSEVCYLN